MGRKYTIEEICAFSKEELNAKLKEGFHNQKLSPKGRIVARSIEIFFVLIILLSCLVSGDIIYSIIALLALAYAIYRLFKPHGEDKEYLEDLEKVAEGIEQFKKYKNGEIKLELSEKKLKSLEKNILKRLPTLLNGNKVYRVLAFIPLVNTRTDEMDIYRGGNSELGILLNGYIKITGLKEILEEKE